MNLLSSLILSRDGIQGPTPHASQTNGNKGSNHLQRYSYEIEEILLHQLLQASGYAFGILASQQMRT
jgi:hypothetical protein